jgi:glycosyltransferase involved in cell wall biosynthesis
LLDDKPSIKLFLKKLWLKWIYGHVDHAFYTGTNNKAYFNKYGLNDSKLSFAPHAIDNERFATDRTTEVVQLRNRLGIAEHNILLLFAGKLESKKAPLLLLNAFLQLNNPQVHLLFVGDGGLQDALHKSAVKHPNVHFLSFQNQSYMPVIYQACNLFCLPSKGPGETWGLCINEAMAAQKAIIASDKCGCAIDLVTNENGMIFKSGDEKLLESAIKNLTSNPQLLSELGKRSGQLIKNWRFEHIAMAIEEKLQANNIDGK